MSNSLWPHELQPAMFPCPSPMPGACSNSCPSSQWCYPIISSSVIPFSSCLQSLPASGSFPMSQFFASGSQSIWNFSISPSNEYSGMISFRMDWLDLLAVQGTLKSLLQHHSSKASVLWRSAFFTVQLSHPYMTTGKTIALTRLTFVGKIMSLLLNMLSRLVIAFPPRSKCLFISWLQSWSPVILEPKQRKFITVSIVSLSICHGMMGPDAMIFVFWMLGFKPAFSLSSFTFIKRLFSSSSLSAIRVVSSAYLRLLIFLLAILIPACASSSLAFHRIYSAYKLNKPGLQYTALTYSFSYLEPVHCSMSGSNCCFLTCIQTSQEVGKVIWYSHLFKNFPKFVVIHTVKGFGVVSKAKLNVFLELSCFSYDPKDTGNLNSDSSASSKSSLNTGSSQFTYYWSLAWRIASVWVSTIVH